MQGSLTEFHFLFLCLLDGGQFIAQALDAASDIHYDRR